MKIKEAYEKSRYGPSLPGPFPSANKSEKTKDCSRKHLARQSSRSSIESNHNRSNTSGNKSSDDEDLEDFFNKLKRNKAMKK
jgi:hypothetical protein